MLTEMGQFKVRIEGCVFKAMPIKTDNEGVPEVTFQFSVRGRGGLEKLDLVDLSTLLGKVTTLDVIDNQLRIKE